jgi:hypothetical protein
MLIIVFRSIKIKPMYTEAKTYYVSENFLKLAASDCIVFLMPKLFYFRTCLLD